jgi:hypothetical protein
MGDRSPVRSVESLHSSARTQLGEHDQTYVARADMSTSNRLAGFAAPHRYISQHFVTQGINKLCTTD